MSKTFEVQLSTSLETPKPLQHEVQAESFKIPKPVQKSQPTKILTLTQSSKQIQSTKMTRSNISNEQIILDRPIARPRNSTIIAKENPKGVMKKQSL